MLQLEMSMWRSHALRVCLTVHHAVPRSVNPIAWTLYGIIVTQLGQDTTTVQLRLLAPVALMKQIHFTTKLMNFLPLQAATSGTADTCFVSHADHGCGPEQHAHDQGVSAAKFQLSILVHRARGRHIVWLHGILWRPSYRCASSS